MQLPRELFDGVHQARRGTVHRVADDGNVTLDNRAKFSPARARAQFVVRLFDAGRVRAGEDKIIRLQPNHFFQIQSGPILSRLDDGLRAGAAQRVGKKRLAAD